MNLEPLTDSIEQGSYSDQAVLFALFAELMKRREKGEDTEGVVLEIQRLASIGVYSAMTLAAELQLQDLQPMTAGHKLSIIQTSEATAQTRGSEIVARTSSVLIGASEAQASAYAGLIASFARMTGVRMGVDLAAQMADTAPNAKMFVRVSRAKEPRTHSIYEGTTRPLWGTWIMGGIAASGPGDPRLPASETVRCGHSLWYTRQEEA